MPAKTFFRMSWSASPSTASEVAEVTEKLAQLNSREEKLKADLNKLRDEAGRPGFRYGSLTFQSIRVSGKRTLDKMLLLENGCPIRVLEASYKEGKPSLHIVFRNLDHDA